MSNDDGIWTLVIGSFDYDYEQEHEIAPNGIVIDLARDWLPAEGLCEIPPVEARLLSARPPRVPAVRDLDLNYSQPEKEKTLIQVEQKITTVS